MRFERINNFEVNSSTGVAPANLTPQKVASGNIGGYLDSCLSLINLRVPCVGSAATAKGRRHSLKQSADALLISKSQRWTRDEPLS